MHAVPEGALAAAKEAQDTKTEEDDTVQPEVAYVEPTMVKTLLGKGHPLFSTRQQQDAMDYFTYFLEKLETCVVTLLLPFPWTMTLTTLDLRAPWLSPVPSALTRDPRRPPV